MSLSDLKKILTPPDLPLETSDLVGWAMVEKNLNTSLPKDYKDFINCYGTGSIDNFLWIFNPFSINENINLLNRLQIETESFRYIREYADEDLPYQMYPHKNGLLPLGATDTGDILFWQVADTADMWSIVISEARTQEYERFAMDLVLFLIKLLSRKIKSQIFPKNFPSKSISFISIC